MKEWNYYEIRRLISAMDDPNVFLTQIESKGKNLLIFKDKGKNKGKWYKVIKITKEPTPWNDKSFRYYFSYYNGKTTTRFESAHEWSFYEGILGEEDKKAVDFLGIEVELNKYVFGARQGEPFIGVVTAIKEKNVRIKLVKGKDPIMGYPEIDMISDKILMVTSQEHVSELLMAIMKT